MHLAQPIWFESRRTIKTVPPSFHGLEIYVSHYFMKFFVILVMEIVVLMIAA